MKACRHIEEHTLKYNGRKQGGSFEEHGRITDFPMHAVKASGTEFHGHATLVRGVERESDTEKGGSPVAESRVIVLMPEKQGTPVSRLSSPLVCLKQQPAAYAFPLEAGQHR